MRSLSNLLSHLQNFYPRPLRGGRPDRRCRRVPARPISIHALCEEGDGHTQAMAIPAAKFLSTPSARRATGLRGLSAPRHANFYPRPLRGGRRQVDMARRINKDFYPRPLRGGRRNSMLGAIQDNIFLSTPSARRATIRLSSFSLLPSVFLSTPSARRATCSPRFAKTG